MNALSTVAAGRNHSLALLEDGSVVGFGNDAFGQATAPDLGGRSVLLPPLPRLEPSVVRAILLAGHHGMLRSIADAGLLRTVVGYLAVRDLGPGSAGV